MLKIEKLYCKIENNEILRGVNLEIGPGEIHMLMGANGSGKSTLAKSILGHPSCEITQGNIKLNEDDITDEAADVRAKKGLFMAFQYPIEVPGVSFRNFLRLAYNAQQEEANKLPVFKFQKLLREKAELLDIDPAILDRNLNEGLSGGEKKKSEILQLAVLQPKIAILDETDSGLDIDALRIVFDGVRKLIEMNPGMGVLIISHYQRILEQLKPNFIHVMHKGKIVESGGVELVEEINKNGYKKYQD